MTQRPDQVLVRAPGNRFYNPPVLVGSEASKEWEYAVLSENAYVGHWRDKDMTPAEQPPSTLDAYRATCADSTRLRRIPLDGWRRWEQFPSDALIDDAGKYGLYVEVWQTESIPQRLAVVFRGTDSLKDWLSNLRWFFWFLRFIPGWEDQYHLVSRRLGVEFSDRFLAIRNTFSTTDPTILSVGHSLGGGLAQHFAYSLRVDERVPRVSHVYAFDPSPVTGWYSVDSQTRQRNASALKIDRIFEHGEILAYIRLLLSYVYPPSDKAPGISEVRYNFVESINPFKSHSMRQLACDLVNASGHMPLH